MARIFGVGTSSQSQQQRRLPLGFQVETQKNDGADKLFLHGISKSGVFEEEISSLDEKDADTAGRLLCWAAQSNKHPDVIKRLGEKCGDLSATLSGCPPLICAIMNGHTSAVKQLLAMGAPVNAITQDPPEFFCCTALHCAVGIGDAGIVNALLVAGADVNFTDDLGKTALHHACDVAAVDVAVELLKHGADVNKRDRTSKTPVDIAVAHNSCPLMRNMISFGKKPSAMAAASSVEQCRGKQGWEEMFELLVEHKWGPRDRETPGGNLATGTPVSATPTARAAAAAAKGEASSRQRAPMPHAGSALHRAAGSGDCDRLEELLSLGEDPSTQGMSGFAPLHVAAMLGRVEVVQTLLRAKAAPDARDRGNLTPLLTAANAGKAAVVAALLKGGASPNLKDSKGFSALGNAVQLRFPDVVSALIDGGASVNAGGEKGITPLHIACELGTAATVDTLLSAGALPGHCWNDMLQSPLMVACCFGHLDVVNLLLPKLSKRQINMRDRVHKGGARGGATALMAAIEYCHGDMDIVQALLNNGADPTVRMTSTNLSPLEHTVVYENTGSDPTLGPRMVRALVKAGADVDEMGPQGCTPLHQACFEGACGEVVQALLDAGANACLPCAGHLFKTPLQLAGCGGNPGALRVMIGLPEYGGLNTVGAPPERATVLACAVRHGQTEAVRFLLEEGADIDLLPFEEDGITLRAKSLVHLAMAGGHGDIVSLLLQARQYKQESELLAGGVQVAP